MTVRITTLCENTAGKDGVVAEFGWSVLVEIDGLKVLFDTGADISVAHNAEALGIDLGQIDKIVLSHGHPDHTGGLRQVLQKMNKKGVEIIAHPRVWATRYNRSEKGDKFVGIPFQRPELESLGAVFRLIAEPVQLTENVMTTGELPMVTDFEDIAPPLSEGSSRWIQEDSELKPDKVLDDRAMIIKTPMGLVIVLGCSHRGIINTLSYAQKLTGVKQIYAVVGGAHLATVSEERVWQTVAALREFDIQKIGLCHCTGLPASAIMAQEFGDRFFFNNTGTVTEIP